MTIFLHGKVFLAGHLGLFSLTRGGVALLRRCSPRGELRSGLAERQIFPSHRDTVQRCWQVAHACCSSLGPPHILNFICFENVFIHLRSRERQKGCGLSPAGLSTQCGSWPGSGSRHSEQASLVQDRNPVT